jgi:hypothetical protein
LLRRSVIQVQLCQVFAKSLRLYHQRRQPLIRYQFRHRHHHQDLLCLPFLLWQVLNRHRHQFHR